MVVWAEGSVTKMFDIKLKEATDLCALEDQETVSTLAVLAGPKEQELPNLLLATHNKLRLFENSKRRSDEFENDEY